MIFSVRQLQEKCNEQNVPFYVVFIDLTKALDPVSREGLLAILLKIIDFLQISSTLRSLFTETQVRLPNMMVAFLVHLKSKVG